MDLASATKAKVPAGSAGRGQVLHAASRERGNPLRAFSLFVFVPAIFVFLGTCFLAFVSLHLMTAEINRVAAERTRSAISASVELILDQLAEKSADEANWTEAYLNTYPRFDLAWLDDTWGTGARRDSLYDTVVVTDSQGDILFGEARSGRLEGRIQDVFSGAGVLQEGLIDPQKAALRGKTSTALALSGNAVFVLAASIINGSSGQLTISAIDTRTLWFAKELDAELLTGLARQLQAPIPRVELDAGPNPDEQSLPLLDAAGDRIANLVWLPIRPGDGAFAQAAGFAALVLLCLGVLTFTVLTGFRRSVQRRAEADERDWFSTRYDSATGLMNQFGLEEAISRAVPAQGELSVAMARIELEGVKDFAANYGQQTAEALLARLASLMVARIDGRAQVARIGLDDFAICSVETHALARVREAAHALFDIVSDVIPLDDLRPKLAASIGIAEKSVTRGAAGQVFEMAAAAMQRARENGGNQIVTYEPSIEARRQRRLALQADIRRGVDAEEFDLVYQPIFDFSSQTLAGVEALMRWPRRPGGAMSPSEFIPAAETSGLIEELGMLALRQACNAMKDIPRLKLSVNVSTVQFRSPALASRIDAVLASTRFPASRLQLEITESFLLTRPERAKKVIEELRGRGISIALDDFGTGFSSVGYLRQFRFDRVKLDRSLVSDIDLDPVKLALVDSTMVFAFAMGLSVTAEGVERREEAAALTRLGCSEFQGFLFSRPLSLEGLHRLLGENEGMLKSA